MLNVDIIRHTKVYQEAKEEGRLEGKIEGRLEGKFEGRLEGKLEGKLEIIPKLIEKSMSIQEIAQILELDCDFVRNIIELSLIGCQDLTRFREEVKKMFN